MLSQFFILSARGDTIIIRDFRLDLGRETSEIFFRKVKFWKGDPPPCFTVEGINFFYTKKFGIFFVATTKHNVSPSFVMDILYRMMKVFRDYCGVLNEESIRKNFVLIYELIDEIIDYGHPQLMTTENIKQFIVNEAILIQQKQQQSSNFRPTIFSSNTIPSTAIQRPLSQITDKKSMKNEIFVDIFEKLTVVFNANGFVINSSIDGVIQMKSYLQGNPELRLVLNDDLVVGRANAGAGGGQVVGSVVLDDCNFHECVDVRDFEAMKTLTINPPDGEFLVMNYRIIVEIHLNLGNQLQLNQIQIKIVAVKVGQFKRSWVHSIDNSNLAGLQYWRYYFIASLERGNSTLIKHLQIQQIIPSNQSEVISLQGCDKIVPPIIKSSQA